ncbi:MAG: hypothetical protein FJY56_18070 [Betaproteobacteria bacterium]|nr:hypothetical protein [Betaproteobacteria bacterium]
MRGLPLAECIANRAKWRTAQLAIALGQPLVMDNRSGAGTMLASKLIVKASADGYTLFMATTSHAINAGIHKKFALRPDREFCRDRLCQHVALFVGGAYERAGLLSGHVVRRDGARAHAAGYRHALKPRDKCHAAQRAGARQTCFTRRGGCRQRASGICRDRET